MFIEDEDRMLVSVV